MRLLVLISGILASMLASACATVVPPGAPPPSAPMLTDTEWRLVAFQSPEDSIGTIRPKQDEVYTIHFQPNGEVSAQLFCNRGHGSWSSPDPHAARASLTIGQMAVTRAMCLPTPLERLERDLNRVSSFAIADGRLHLNLQMDSGDYIWEPTH